MDKFIDFIDYLKRETRDDFYIELKEIERMIGQPLSKSAYNYSAYWSISGTHFLAIQIYECGFKVQPDLKNKRIRLYRINSDSDIKRPINEGTPKTIKKERPMVVEYDIDTSDDPYALDYAIKGDLRIPALTRKNARFIEAVVGLDSNYNRDADIYSEPDKGFDVFANVSSSDNKYCGSSAYWFNKMVNGGNFEECLLGAIISIDRTNSTHLESAIDGRTKMKNIIMRKCHNVKELKEELNKDFRVDPKNHLIGLMCQELPAKGKESTRSNLSFASKFCAYASLNFKSSIEYSKYDNVVTSHLGKYIDVYLKDSYYAYKYKYSSERKRNSEDKLQYMTDIYCTYYKIIGDIIAYLKDEKGINIDRNEFDHIVWYGFKGKE